MTGFQRPERIGIVGAGIGGLTLAGLLADAGFEPVVFEQAAQLRAVGAGLIVAPNAARVLDRLGALEHFAKRAVVLETGWEFRRWADGRVLFSQQLGQACRDSYGVDMFVAHRADLLDALRAFTPDLRLGMRCSEIEQHEDGVLVRFADGTTAELDAVVGADGIHSVVRGVVAEQTPPRFSGLCAFRALVPSAQAPEFARRPVQTLWLGPDHHLVHYPVSGGELVNLVAFAPTEHWRTESWSAQGRVEDFVAEFAHWDSRLRTLIEAAPSTGRWALFDRDPLPRWTRGRVTLLGDAAHPMFPFLAQGAAQAMEDAAVLTRCLTTEPATAFARYEQARLPRATLVQQRSRGRATSNHLPDGPEQQARDAALSGQDPLGYNEWLYGFDANTVALP